MRSQYGVWKTEQEVEKQAVQGAACLLHGHSINGVLSG
jgi:hypothetical protein